MTTDIKFTLLLLIATSGVMMKFAVANISLGSCSLSCGNEGSDTSDIGLSHSLRGFPGKRGPAGQRGSQGLQGISGATGAPGDSCDCSFQDKFQEELDKLKASIIELRKLSGWFKGENGLYYKLFEEKLNYDNAKTKCGRFGGRLASTGWRDARLKREFERLYLTTARDFWLGLDDIGIANRWVWSDNVIATRQNTNWRTGEPNGSNEHCAIVHYDGGTVHDVLCNREFVFICEIVF